MTMHGFKGELLWRSCPNKTNLLCVFTRTLGNLTSGSHCFHQAFQMLVCMWEFHQKVIHKANFTPEGSISQWFCFSPRWEMAIKLICKGASKLTRRDIFAWKPRTLYHFPFYFWISFLSSVLTVIFNYYYYACRQAISLSAELIREI